MFKEYADNVMNLDDEIKIKDATIREFNKKIEDLEKAKAYEVHKAKTLKVLREKKLKESW
jgi:flagellar biosynthesis chaperone FliJ